MYNISPLDDNNKTNRTRIIRIGFIILILLCDVINPFLYPNDNLSIGILIIT